MHNDAQLSGELTARQIKPTRQRLEIWAHLQGNPDHPTCESIYNTLHPCVADLSLATVYNTMNLFAEKGLVKSFQGEDGKIHFDPYTQDHGHFFCHACQRYWDLELTSLTPNIQEPPNFRVEHAEIILVGLCEDCLRDGSN